MRFHPPTFLQTLADVEQRLTTPFATLTDAQFFAPPAPGQWAIGHCLQHLVRTGNAFLPLWAAALSGAPKRPSGYLEPSYSLTGRAFLWMLRPPYRMKVKTSPAFQPLTASASAADASAQPTRQAFAQMHAAVRKTVEKAQSYDLRGLRIRSPFAEKISYPASYSFDVFLVHELRHAWQAEQVRQKLGF